MHEPPQCLLGGNHVHLTRAHSQLPSLVVGHGLVSLDTSQSHAGLYPVGFTLLVMLPQSGRELALSAYYVPGNFLGALQK